MDMLTFLPYLLVMAGVTYLIRALPFVLVNKKIENRFLNSFLYYIPYTVLAAMTFPAILYGDQPHDLRHRRTGRCRIHRLQRQGTAHRCSGRLQRRIRCGAGTDGGAVELFRNAPVDGFLPCRLQKCIGSRKILSAEITSMCRQWTRMYALDDAVLLSRDESFLSLCKAAPENEYHWFFSGVKMLDHLIREDLPALALVRACRPPANRQNRIEQEHAVFRPAFQIAVVRRIRSPNHPVAP